MNANKLFVAAVAASLVAAPLVAGADRQNDRGRTVDSAAAVLPLVQAMALAEAYSGGKVVAIEGRGYSASQVDVAAVWRVRVAKPDGTASRLVIDGSNGALMHERAD